MRAGPLTTIESDTVVLPTADIDTDQIIPARFLTTTSRDGLGKFLFHDLRYDGNGAEREDFPLNSTAAKSSSVLVAGNNFGCGSSREHAAWALSDFGIRAVISTEIADIFRSNALKNGLLPIVVDASTHAWLLANPGAPVAIDVHESTLRLPEGRKVTYPIDAFARYCLTEGMDQLGYLRSRLGDIRAFEEKRNWKP